MLHRRDSDHKDGVKTAWHPRAGGWGGGASKAALGDGKTMWPYMKCNFFLIATVKK